MAGLLGKERSAKIELSPEVEVPVPPAGLPGELRVKLLGGLAALLGKKRDRRAVEAVLRFEPNALDGHPSADVAAAVALVLATGDDDPFAAARRIVDVLIEELEEESLRPLADEIAAARPPEAETGLLGE